MFLRPKNNPKTRLATKVEIDRACIRLAKQEYPDSCTFKNILDLVHEPKDESGWSPSKLRIKKRAFCEAHSKEQLRLQTSPV